MLPGRWPLQRQQSCLIRPRAFVRTMWNAPLQVRDRHAARPIRERHVSPSMSAVNWMVISIVVNQKSFDIRRTERNFNSSNRGDCFRCWFIVITEAHAQPRATPCQIVAHPYLRSYQPQQEKVFVSPFGYIELQKERESRVVLACETPPENSTLKPTGFGGVPAVSWWDLLGSVVARPEFSGISFANGSQMWIHIICFPIAGSE